MSARGLGVHVAVGGSVRERLARFGLVGLLWCVGCGNSTPMTPEETCREMAAAWCERFYACFSADQVAAAGLPVSADECARDRALAARCSEITPENACSAGLSFDSLGVDGCVGAIGDVACSQLDGPEPEPVEMACRGVCVIPEGCAEERCDPTEPGCGTGACRLDALCGTRCDPEVGDGRALATCGTDADCAEGYLCQPEVHLCTELCSSAHACGPGRACVGVEHADAGVTECSDGCRPGRYDCPADQTCIVVVSPLITTYCDFAGTRPEGADCARDADCAPSLVCLAEASGANARCVQFCDESTPCVSQRSCVFYDPPLIYDGHYLGNCL